MTDMNLVIRAWGERGWKWVAQNSDGYGTTFRTDGEGNGLFRLQIDHSGQEQWVQERGTCQYQLPGDRDRAIRKIGRRNIATEAQMSTLKGRF